MIAQECHPCRPETPSYGILKRFFCWFAKIRRRYAQWREIQEQLEVLKSMDDRMLKDIGLSRCDAVRLTTGYDFHDHMRGRPTGPGSDGRYGH